MEQVSEPPNTDSLQEIGSLVKARQKLAAQKTELEEELKQTAQLLQDIDQNKLPSLMDTYQLTDLSFDLDGETYRISMAESHHPNTKYVNDNFPQIQEYLESVGDGAIIKRQLTLSAAKESAETFRDFTNFVQEQLEQQNLQDIIDLQDQNTIHYQTLRKYVSERLSDETLSEAEADRIRSLFGVFHLRYTKINKK